MSEFNGAWQGTGTDRDSPLESAQPTRCQIRIRADDKRLSSTTTCNRDNGFSKVLHFTVTLDGNRLTGNASQTGTAKGGQPKTLGGPVKGDKAGDTATLLVRTPGMTPNANIVLKHLPPSSFSLTIGSLGATLTDVTFRRAGDQRRP